jgi:YHS domain-containing protein
MAKDPVCRMNVDESKTQYTSEVNGQKIYYVENNVKKNLTKIHKSMDTNRKRVIK